MTTTTVQHRAMGNLKSLASNIIACFVLLTVFLDLINASTKTFAIYEERAPGEFVGNLSSRILHVHPTPSEFHFNLSSGVIKSAVTLDREQKSSYTFTVITSVNIPFTVNIEVLDINDEFPMFSKWNKTDYISEAYDVGHIYDLHLQVADKDEGVNSIQNDSVKIVSGNQDDVFKIYLKKHEKFYAVSLKLAKKLNWSAQYKYVLNLSASDTGTPRKTSYMKLTVIVQDYNNCRPQFSRQNYQVDVSESVKKGTVVLNITTSDCDGGKNAEVTYKMNYNSYYDKDGHFTIKQKGRTGSIMANLALDYELNTNYKLQVIATDKGNPPKHNTADIAIHVRDENDNPPQISTFNFFPVNEDAEVDSRVASIKIHDKDSGENGKLNVSLIPMNIFSIVKHSQGIYYVLLKTILDYEQMKTYHIIVTVTDNGKPPQTSQKDGSLLIGDVNDNPPKFSQDIYPVNISESVKPGTPVFTIHANDVDTVSTSNITYHILATTYSSWFGINSTSGVINVAFGVDREQSDIATLVIQAFDGRFSANCTVVFNIFDSNDNAPKFEIEHYTMTVLENLQPGTFVGKVSASDADLTSRGHISFSLGHISNNAFVIDNTTGNITTLKELDREQIPMYNFSVIVQDEDHMQTTAMVTIIVGDDNDNRPFFKSNFYNYSVFENITVGTNLVKLEADDYDIGWNAQISYEIISGNVDGTFALDNSNGQISLHKELDREKLDKYELKFRAIDNGGKTSHTLVTVEILVKDVNDDPPVFQKDKYNFDVKENGSVSVFVGDVIAKSYDQGSGGIISYSIKTVAAQQHFYINNSGAIFTNAKLDHEIQSKYELMIEAQDHGNPPLFGYVNVTVSVIDINDNSPTWNGDIEQCITQSETEFDVGDVFHVFNASDKDSGLNGRVTYRIVSGGDPMFHLDTETGNLSLNIPFDYEQVQSYHLVVSATDSGNPALWSLLNVDICVTDENDNTPVLNNSSITVSEDVPINTLIYTFHAVDKDKGKIWYKFSDYIPSNFTLTTDGNLTLTSSLDREKQDKYEVHVFAGDSGVPHKISTPAKLTIHVQDVNDETPTFTKKFSFSTIENKISRTSIGRVEATDHDLGNNSVIEYSILNGTENFKIDSSTGELRNIAALDRETFSVYRVEVQASDKGVPPKSSTTVVDVHVQDVNDNPPKFPDGGFKVSVAENVIKGSKIAHVKATDEDEGQNGEVFYLLHTGNLQNGVEMFQINETTGFIYILQSLDREIKDYFVLSIVGTDKGHPPQDSICRVYITVLDVNDHKPEFKVKNDTIFIAEKLSVGSVVYLANATDQDKNENGNIIYSIVKVTGEQVFRINGKSGAVILNKTLDYEHTKQYSIRIKASDTAKDNPKKSILRLYINILDSNDNGPIFDENPLYGFVFENEPRGTIVKMKPIVAHDKDSGINSRIVYSIESQSPKAAFKINPFNAQLTTDVEIDREDVREYTLVVKAVDQAAEVSQQRSNTVTVIIMIEDINDCSPVFTSRNNVFIMEDEPVGVYSFFYFTAEDKDDKQAGNVTYSLVDGNDDGIFYLDPREGSLMLMKPLDREKVDSYILRIKASDQGSPPKYTTINFTLSVEDVNDNKPQFTKFTYKVDVPENDSISDIVRVEATDLDSGQLKYNLQTGFSNELFTIDETSGQISTKHPLDREKRQSYVLTVYVEDHGFPVYTDKATVIINVTDKNDNAPHFLHNSYEIKVPENFPVGFIFSIVAQDSDSGKNARLSYTIEGGDDSGFFKIDKNTGTLSTVKELDRENIPAFHLIIEVKDSGVVSLSTRVNVLVIVLDENDNNPKFPSSEMNFTLAGGSTPGTAVVTLTATDDDEDSAMTYTLVSDKKLPFALDSTSGLIYTLSYLNASEVDTYNFVVNASDGSGSGARFGSIKVKVSVLHTTGIPVRFTKVLYKVERNGQVKAGDEILQLELKNRYLQAGDVEFTHEDGQNVLAVGNMGGNVSFTKDPKPGAYLFSVRATLVHDRTTTAVCFVLVTVQHTIQPPRFNHSTYVASLTENDAPGTPVVRVIPLTPGQVSYQIVNGNELDAFNINDNGEVTVKTSNALDYERSPSFELDIKGDWGNTITNIAFTKLYITLRNLNDKAPEFRQRVFVSSIAESSVSVDTRFVTKLHAFNFGNSQLSFKIVSGSNGNVFKLNSLTGELSLQRAVYREQKNVYNLTISASTGQLSSNCIVLVYVTDINNNRPWLPKIMNFTIPENSPLGSHVGQVNATDKDEYSVITYSFSGKSQRYGPFVIDLYTGILSLVGVVDFETTPNLYTMDVFASDQLHLISTKVSVTVLDENDNRPLFEKSSYNVRRQAIIPKQSLLARINATDQDQGKNGEITYNITFNQEIEIDPNTGIVKTKMDLTYNKDFIDLIISATDHGRPELSSQVPFRLQLLVVDKLPEFFPTYDVTILENTKIGTEVVRIQAIIPGSVSGNKRISFQIDDGDALKMFRIEERNGIIRVRRQLDREHISLYNLVVRAKPDQAQKITVRIKIGDVNDNAPIFRRTVYEKTIAEDDQPPLYALRVLAKDNDIGLNGKINYSISSGNDDGLFSINNDGELVLIKSVDRDVIEIHRLSVRATDQGTPPMASDISVVIKVNDTNDNTPVFMQPRELGVAENSPDGTYAGTIRASDLDSGENQKISYAIINGTGLGLFKIEEWSGNLTSAVTFDYEKKSSYFLVVSAQDQGTPPRCNIRKFTMPIIGVDEYPPKFLKKSYEFIVSGTAKKNDTVGRVLAKDSDGGLEGMIKYGLSAVSLFAINSSSGEIYLTEDVQKYYESKRQKRDTESSEKPDSFNLTISASSGQPGSKVETVTAHMSMNYTAPLPPPTPEDPSISDAVQTIIIAISIVASLALLALLVWLFIRCKRKEEKEAKKPSEEMVLRPIAPLQTSVNSVEGNGLINRYEHVPTSASNSLGSSSSGNGSSDAGSDKLDSRNLQMIVKTHVGSNNADSGIHCIHPDSDGELSPNSDVENSDTRSLDVRSDRTDRMIAHLESIESLHDFDDEGGREASAGLDVGNLLYAKLAEADAEEDDQNVDRPRVFVYEGRPDYTGSLSSILGSHEELRGQYNYFYAMNQGPQYQPLSEVFSEIGRLPNSNKENILGSQLNGVNDYSARTSMLSSVSSLHNQHLDPESTYSSLPMTPNFTPSFTPLVTRSPSLSPLNSEAVTPMVSPSQSRPSSMYLPRSRPSSSLIHLTGRDVLHDFDDDVHV